MRTTDSLRFRPQLDGFEDRITPATLIEFKAVVDQTAVLQTTTTTRPPRPQFVPPAQITADTGVTPTVKVTGKVAATVP